MGLSIERPDLPYALQVEITSHCNLHCRMCPLTIEGTPSSQSPGNAQELSWREVVKMACEIRNVIIAGFGEPLLHPQCLSMMRELDRHSVWMSLATNGTAITLSTAGQLAAIPNLMHINVSIDSPDPATYRAIRGGELEHALRGLRNLMTCIDNPDRVTVSSVAMSSNLATLAQFPPLLAELGVKRYVLQGLAQFSAECERESLLDPVAAAEAVERLRFACREAGVQLASLVGDRIDSAIASDEGIPATSPPFQGAARNVAKVCSLPWEIPFIDKDGRVFPCCYASTQSSELLGDLRTESLHAVWEGQRYQRFRADILEGSTTPEVCRSCTIVPFGDHPIRSFAAELLLERSNLRANELVLLARNTGSRTWTPADSIRIGTANPRDHSSPLATAGWLSSNRVTTFCEDRVRPGEIATFRFTVLPVAGCPLEMFQLLAEGSSWIPNTRFRVDSAHPFGKPKLAVHGVATA
jgi:radical SAM protein with 4Fe4S-binding SPASM domain